MATLLIYARNNVHADPVKDARGCYKLGDIVEVLDDSKYDGDLVRNPIAPEWYIVRITDVTKAQVLHFMESHVEPRPATRTWNRKRWEEAQVTGQYEEFVSVPVPGAVSDKTETITVADKQYQAMVTSGNFNPFYYVPSSVKTTDVVVDLKTLATEKRHELTGVVSYIELTGDVPTTLRRRKFNVEVDTLPLAFKQKMAKDRYAEVTLAQVKNYIRNRMTGGTA
jgi:hypothetical protein